jgi:hypothetical protein
MKSSSHWLGKQLAASLILLLSLSTSEAGSALAQQAVQRNSQNPSSAPANANQALAKSELPENPLPVNSQPPDQGQPTTAPEAGAGQSQNNVHKPVGTAAAPYEPTLGIAASRPAGAAIAPAKQRRVRTILISLGVIAGAGIAIGSVAALSHGSPSHP